MTRWLAARPHLQVLAALMLGAAAGFVIMDPGSTFATTMWPAASGQFGALGWGTVFLAAPGVGVLVAAFAAAAAPSGRRAWGAAAAALVGVAVAQAPVLDSVVAQACQRYAVVALAGLAVGAGAAAVWRQRGPAIALVVGAVLSFMLAGPLNALVRYDALPRHLPEYIDRNYALSPWWWLLAAGAALAVAAALGVDGAGQPAEGGARRAVAAAALVAVGGISGVVIAGGDPATWGRIVAGLLVTFAALGVAAWLLPNRDGGVLFAMLAVGAVGAPLADEVVLSIFLDVGVQARVSRLAVAVVLVAAAVLVGIGAWAGARWPRPAMGLGVLALVPLLGIPDLDDPFPMTIARLLIAAVAAGFALVAARPSAATSGAIGVTGLFVLMAPVVLVPLVVPSGWVAYTPLSDKPSDGAGSFVGEMGLSGTGAYLVIAAVVLICGVAIKGIGRRRGLAPGAVGTG